MTTPRAGKIAKFERELSAGSFTIILLNNPTGFDDDEMDMAKWLQYEPLQQSGGYQPQAWSYTPGSYVVNSGNIESPEGAIQFLAAGTGYAYTHIAQWQGRGTTSSKTVSAIDTSTNRLTVTGHGLSAGDRAFITSTGTRPAISSGEVPIQNYWVNPIDSNTIVLCSNSGLTTVVDFVSAGSGTVSLRYSNGSIWNYETASGTVNPGSPKNFTNVYRKTN